MYEGDRDLALAHRRCHALDIPSEDRGSTRGHIDLACELTRSVDRNERLRGTGRKSSIDYGRCVFLNLTLMLN